MKVKDLIRLLDENEEIEIFAYSTNDSVEYICTPKDVKQQHLDFIVTYIGCGPAWCNITKCDPTKMLLIDCEEGNKDGI